MTSTIAILKRFKTFLFTTTFLIAMQSFAQQTGDSFAIAKKSKEASIVYIHSNVTGYAAVGDNGKTEGLLVDLMSKFEEFVLNKYGITMKSSFVAAPNNDFKTYLEIVKNSSGGVFGLANTSVSEERKKSYEFSPAFLSNISVLVSNSSFPTLDNLEKIGSSFAKKNGYASASSTHYRRMIEIKNSYFSEMAITTVKSGRATLESVGMDLDGYGFVDINFYIESLKSGQPIKRHPVGDQMGDQLAIVMPKGSDWSPLIADFLNSGVLKTPEYRQMVIRHFSKEALRMID